MNMDYQKILQDIYNEILPYATEGKQADYIPALAKIDPDQFGMCLETVSGEVPSSSLDSASMPMFCLADTLKQGYPMLV